MEAQALRHCKSSKIAYKVLLIIVVVILYAEADQLNVDEQLLHAGDYEALKALRSSLADLPGSSFFDTWDFDTSVYDVYPCTSFAGLICDFLQGDVLRVRELNLGTDLADSPGLTGILHPAIANLTGLQQLTLSPGLVRGPLPHTLGALQQLQFLGISKNQISGSIPVSLASLRALQTLDLSFNNLGGALPANLLQLPNLQVLLLSHNRLVGRLHDISSPLLHLDLQQNALSGPLPSSLPPSLSFLSLAHNKIYGNISALAPLTNLYFLDLSFNKLTGNLPPELLGQSLHAVVLQHNQLWGAIEPASLVSVEILDLSYNEFSGEISPLLSTAANLYLNNNRLTGQVPQEFADQLLSGQLLNLYLQHNLVTQFLLDPQAPLPLTTSLCIDFNCMETPSQSHCPDTGPSSPDTGSASGHADKSMQVNQCGH